MPNNRLNRLTLNTVPFQGAVFTPIEYKPVSADYSILERSAARLEERRDKASKEQTALEAAIANVDLDPSEDAFKQQYIEDLNQEINKYTSVGDYGGAYRAAIRLAGEAAKDPRLTARERYNKDRQKWLQELEVKRNKGLISDDSYNRAIAQNVYAYQDITQDGTDNTPVIGGTPWTPIFDPVNDITLKDVLDEMKELIGISSETIGQGGGATQYYYNAKGEITNNPSEAVSIAYVTKNGSVTESTKKVTVEDWQNAYNAYISRHPENEVRLNQLWENANFNYATSYNQSNNEALSEEERIKAKHRADEYWNSLTDGQGGLLTKEAWLLKKISPSFSVMAYNQHSLVTENGSTLLDEKTLRNRVIANAMNLSMEQAELYGQGATMEFVLTEDANRRKDLVNQGHAVFNQISNHVVEQ